MDVFDNQHTAFAQPRRRNPIRDALRDPRRRLAVVVGAVLLVAVIAIAAWLADPTNRARRDLAQANERIVDRQHAVEDARRLLVQRMAELRAAQAEADVQVTRYQGALEKATRPSNLDTVTAAGEVVPAGRPVPATVPPPSP